MEKDFKKTWRYKVGLGLFTLGNLLLVIAMLFPLMGIFPSSLLTILVLSGEFIFMASVAVIIPFLLAVKSTKKSPDICQGSFFYLVKLAIKQQQLQFQCEH